MCWTGKDSPNMKRLKKHTFFKAKKTQEISVQLQKFWKTPNNLNSWNMPPGNGYISFLFPRSDMLVSWRADEGSYMVLLHTPLSQFVGGTQQLWSNCSKESGPQKFIGPKHTG